MEAMYATADQCEQTRQPSRSVTWHQVQEVADAFRSNGEHFAFPARMPIPAVEPSPA
jgi:hypothetical protein